MAGTNTLSGLPAISPTRGEKTRGDASPVQKRRRLGRVSPSPFWGGTFFVCGSL